VIPHPFSLLTRSIGRRTLDRVVAIEDPATHPDGLETANPMTLGWDAGARAGRLNEERWRLAETGGSDAHFAETVGAAYTLFPGRTAEDVRRAILRRESSAVAASGTPYRRIGARKLLAQQVRGLAVTPRKVVGPKVARLRDAVATALRAPGA
jgi:predicted metal-dependent phosphoesterase TrpH